MTRVVVTGGAGKAGRAVVRDLVGHGYDVLCVDRALNQSSATTSSSSPT
jgi:nucleoside-diphosphate-sugar epimerase